MKVPFPVNCQNTSKPLNNSSTTATTYEPKSVLDLRRSPSPVAEKPVSNATADILSDAAANYIYSNNDPLADCALINQHFVDWDSLMRELGLHDDSTSTPINKSSHSSDTQLTPTQYSTHSELLQVFDSTQFLPLDLDLLPDIPTYSVAPLINDLNPNNNINTNSFDGVAGENWAVGFDYVDDLIRLAGCFDTNSVQLGHVILARLNQRLTSPAGKPLQRAAFYFKEALQSLLTGSTPHPAYSTSEIVQTIKAQKSFSNISPIPLFSSFTANQAVLESLDGSTANVHVIDFDIGLGGHWASFMKELADKASLRQLAARLRISALVSEEYGNESRLIRDNLTQFARELNIRFDIEFVLIRTFEYLSLKAIKLVDGEKVAVLLSPAIFRHVGTGFLKDIRRVSPHVVVHVGVEGNMDSGTTSYRQAVIDGLEFYSTLLESLEAANFNGGGDWMRTIETFVVFPKILEAAGRRGTWWREALVEAGLRQVGPSLFAEFQAECLLRKVQVRGFHVVKRQADLVLCWQDRPVVATSAWRY